MLALFDVDASRLLTELFAACALVANILAYQKTSVQAYRIYSGLAMLLLAVHFFRLEAYAASVGCSMAIVRNVVSLKYNDWLTTSFFVFLVFVALLVEWFVLAHGPEIFIAYSASIIFTVGTLRLNNVVDIRRWFTLAEGLSLIYAIMIVSVFGSLFSIFNLLVLGFYWVKYFENKRP